MQLDGMIFDLDGTLVDSAPDLAFAANRMLVALGMAARDSALLTTFIGKGIPRLVERSLAGSLDGAADATLRARALPLYERFYAEESGRRTSVYPGVAEGLAMLAGEGLPLACVTNKPGAFTRPLLGALALERYFAVVYGGDAFARKKPDPLPLLGDVDGDGEPSCRVVDRSCVIDSGDLAAHARRIKPDVLLLGNPAYPRDPNSAYARSVWAPLLGRQLDLMFAENGNFPGIEDGALAVPSASAPACATSMPGEGVK